MRRHRGLMDPRSRSRSRGRPDAAALFAVLLTMAMRVAPANGPEPVADWDVAGEMYIERVRDNPRRPGAATNANAPRGGPYDPRWRLLDRAGDVPSARQSFLFERWDAEHAILFGGDSESAFNDTYVVNVAGEWQELATTGTAPSPRFSAAGVVDPVTDQLFVFGGTSGGVYHGNGTYALDLGTGTWSALATHGDVPSGRRNHSAVYRSRTREMVIYGGTESPTADVIFADMHALNLDTVTWREIIPATGEWPARRGHVAEYIEADDSMVVFGGEDGVDFRYDTYVFSLTHRAAVEASTIGWVHDGAYGPPSFFDADLGCLCVFGGYDGSQKVASLSVLTVGTWSWARQPIADVWPSPRHWHKMVFFPARRKAIIFGGMVDGGGRRDETWELDLGATAARDWASY